jgi:hypothetical protein
MVVVMDGGWQGWLYGWWLYGCEWWLVVVGMAGMVPVVACLTFSGVFALWGFRGLDRECHFQ